MSDPGRAESRDEERREQGKPRKMSRAASDRKRELAKHMKGGPNFNVERSISKHANKQDKHHELVHVKRNSLMGALKGKADVLHHAQKMGARESIDLLSGRKPGALGKGSSKMKY